MPKLESKQHCNTSKDIHFGWLQLIDSLHGGPTFHICEEDRGKEAVQEPRFRQEISTESGVSILDSALKAA